jgi:O-antigen/teichoic acid export membrane protein
MVALVLMAGIATIVVVAAVLLSATGLVGHVTADWLQSASGDASAALLLMAVLIAVQLVVVVPEAAQLGLQTQYVSNLWTAIGSAAAIVVMLSLGGAVNSVTAFVLVSQGPQVAARAANGVSFVVGRRYLFHPAGLRLRQHAGPILGSGLAFAGFSLASYVGLQVGLLVVAATVDARSVALAGVIVRGHLMQASGLAVVTTPTWPTIANAIARGDLPWVRRTYRVLLLGGLTYSTLLGVAIFFGLEALIGIWTGSRPPDNVPLRALLAVFVVVNGWGHVNAMTLVGLGVLRFTALVLIAEAVVGLVLQIVLIPVAGVTGYVAALAVGAVALTGWILPLRVRRELSTGAAP